MGNLNKEKVYFPIIFFLIIQRFVPSEIFFVIGLIYLLYIILIKEDGKIFIPFSEYKMLILFLVWGSLIGIMKFTEDETRTLIDLVRDIFYYTNPLIYIYIGSYYSKRNIDINRILNSFIVSGGMLSFLQIIKIVLSSTKLLSINYVQNWRTVTGDGVFVSALALGIIASGIIPKEMRLKGIVKNILIMIMLLEFTITLSRTNMMIFIISYLVLGFNIFMVGKRLPLKKIIVFIVIAVAFFAIIIGFIHESVREAYIEKILSSKNEISSKHEWTTDAEVQKNWRGYETYCAIKDWKKANIIEKIFGLGLGKRIYVGNYAYTLLKQTNSEGKGIDTIAVLHNGYATMLIKQGVLGVALYIIFYALLIIKGIKELKKNNSINARFLTTVGIAFVIQAYFLNGIYKDYCFYPLIILLGYCAYEINKNSIKMEKK